MTRDALEVVQSHLPELLEQLQPGEELTITDPGAAKGTSEKGGADIVALQSDSTQRCRGSPNIMVPYNDAV